jgi:hypothetical protein
MFGSRVFRFSAAIAAALAVTASSVPASLASPLAPSDVRIEQISSDAGKLNEQTDIGVYNHWVNGNSTEGTGSSKTFHFKITNHGPHFSEVEYEATCGFVNPTSGGAAGTTVETKRLFVVNQQTKYIDIVCSKGSGDAAGAVVRVKPINKIDLNQQNNIRYS